MTALVCTATVTPTPASARESSSSTRMYETKSAPAPPYSSGTHTPISPSSASLAKSSRREAVLTVPVGGVRLDLGLRELPRQRLDLPLLGGQLEVHGRSLRGFPSRELAKRPYRLRCAARGRVLDRA